MSVLCHRVRSVFGQPEVPADCSSNFNFGRGIVCGSGASGWLRIADWPGGPRWVTPKV
jgi:hypothetical protein